VLILDDEPDIRGEIIEFLTSKEMQVLSASSPSEAFQMLKRNIVDIAILDIRLPEMSGLDVLKSIRHIYPDIQSIVISGHGDMDTVIQALRLGAVDFFQKPFHLQDMFASIEKNKKQAKLRHLLNGDHFKHALRKAFDENSSASFIIASEKMNSVVDKMRLVARSKDTTVLITGESGTGKELIARGIHHLSPRNDKPFHAVNCSTVPDELFESEFFGITKGAFTGAVADKAGWFEAAEGGTLFLDEIGDLKPNLQAKLLRVMEDKQICRLGSTTSRKIDVRVIAATNQDLQKLIETGRFRIDLYHRVNTFIIHLPPLRERAESIPALIDHYIEYYSQKMQRPVPGMDKALLSELISYDFPGNIRELKHMIERALILCEGDQLTNEHFDHLKLKKHAARLDHSGAGSIKSMVDIERESIKTALAQSQNNKSKAARLLNISRQALDRKIAKLKIELAF
jgi:DNA-binding NtrC family response regulator